MLRCCTTSFSCRKPSWGLVKPGHVAGLLIGHGDDVVLVAVEPAVLLPDDGWVSRARGPWKILQATW